MALKLLKDTIRKIPNLLEAAVLGSDYFLLYQSLNCSDKFNVIWKDIQLRLRSRLNIRNRTSIYLQVAHAEEDIYDSPIFYAVEYSIKFIQTM
jgi:hypothetical protein